jgi:hypothetical protein
VSRLGAQDVDELAIGAASGRACARGRCGGKNGLDLVEGLGAGLDRGVPHDLSMRIISTGPWACFGVLVAVLPAAARAAISASMRSLLPSLRRVARSPRMTSTTT